MREEKAVSLVIKTRLRGIPGGRGGDREEGGGLFWIFEMLSAPREIVLNSFLKSLLGCLDRFFLEGNKRHNVRDLAFKELELVIIVIPANVPFISKHKLA